MTTPTTIESSPAHASRHDIAVVRSGYDALARGDLAAFREAFHDEATWNHRNNDRFAGIKHGSDAIVTFVADSGQLTAGTLRAIPQTVLTDDEGRVAVLTRVSATRPDGRSFDDAQIMLFVVDGDRIRAVDQFVGDPATVTAFWA